MKKKQTDRLREEKIKGQGPKEIFGENAQKHDTSVNNFSKVVFETLKKIFQT
jgi:type II restriction enzyme